MVIGCQPLTGGSMRWLKDTVSGLSNPHDAAARNRISKMRKYVQQGGDVNKQNKLGDTPLHEACAYIRDNGESSKGKKQKGVAKGGRKVVKRFAQQGEFVREDGPIEMLELLVDSGSDINAQNIVGDAPLHKAALNGRALAADFLIRKGANVNIRNEFAQTPLHAACVSGSMEIVQRLVQGGADTSAQDAAEDTPFHEACRHQYENIVIFLMGRVNNPETSEGLKLWRGLDSSWAKILRSSAQGRIDNAGGQVKHPAAAGGASVATVSGSSPAAMYLNTPSTVHNSLQSAESERGRTPSESKFGGSHKEGDGGGGPSTSVNGEAVGSVRSSQITSKPQPKGAAANGVHRQTQPVRAGDGGGDVISKENNGQSRTQSKPGRPEVVAAVSKEMKKSPRSFSTRPSEVLDWQASKVKNVEQGKVIEKAREALCEEQQEDTMGLSSATFIGDEDSGEWQVNVNGGDTVEDREEIAELRVATSMVADRSFKETRKNSPMADGRTTPLTCIIRDVSVSSPTREGVRRKTKSVVVLPSPRARVLRRSTAFPVSEKMVNGKDGGSCARRGRKNCTDGSSGGERISRRRPPSVPTSDAKLRSRTGSRASDAPSEKGQRRSLSSRSRKEAELVVVGGDADAGGMGKSHHRKSSGSSSGHHRHKERDGATRSPGRRHKEDRSRSGRDKAYGSHRSRRDVGESGRGQRSHRRSGDDRGLEESKTALLNGTKEHRTASASANCSSVSSKRDGSKRELKRLSRHVDEMSVDGDEATSATKVLKEAPKVTRNGGLLLVKQDSGYANHAKEFRREDGEVKSGEASANEGVWVKRPPRRTGSSQELVPPTWASELDSGLDKVLPPKKVVESPLPIRRKSPYRPYRISSPSPRPKGAVAELGSAPKKKGVFFPIHAVPVPPMSSPTSLQKKREDALLKAAADASASVESGDPSDASCLEKKQGDVSPKVASDSIACVKSGCTTKVSGEVSGVGNASVADSCEVGAGGGEGGTTVRGAVPRRPKNVGGGPEVGLVSRAETLDDGPPNMEALHSEFPLDGDESSGAGSGAVTGGSSAGVEVIMMGKGGIPMKTTSWVKSTDETMPKHAAAGRPSEIVFFSDSETDNDRSSSARYSSRASHTFGDVDAVTSLAPATTKSSSDADSDEPKPSIASAPDHASDEAALSFISVAGTALSDEDVERAMEKSAEGAASSLVFHSSFGSTGSLGSGQNGAVAAAVAAAATAAVLPPATLSIQPSEKTESECRESDAESISSSRAWVAGARAAAADAQAEAKARMVREESKAGERVAEGGSEIPSVIEKESSSSVNPRLVVASSVIPSSRVAIPEAAAGIRVEDEKTEDSQSVLVWPPPPKLPMEAARKRSTLGRRGRPSVKVTMPIVGGRAAWDKFLADAGVNDADDAAESAFHGDGAGNKPEGADVEKKGHEGDEGATAESAEASEDSAEEDDALNERVPRGFKDPNQVDGPNKGPAGAFSGNAMWRLAGGPSSAANRARSGVELDGDGGFSNPLSAMRAADPRISQAGTDGARGGMFPNPLAGVRGAAGMTNAGIANPLARGRGALYGAAGVVNPLVGGGGGSGGRAVTANPLARRSIGAGTASITTQGENSEGSTKGLSASTLGGGRTSAPTVIRNSEASLRVSHFSPEYSSAFVSASAKGSSAGGDDFANDGSRAMGFDGVKGVESRVKGVLPLGAPRRRARSSLDNELRHGADRDPGQAKVASVVMAFQKPTNHRAGLMIADPHQVEVSTVAEQGLVQLRRVNWSPHPSQREKANVA